MWQVALDVRNLRKVNEIKIARGQLKEKKAQNRPITNRCTLSLLLYRLKPQPTLPSFGNITEMICHVHIPFLHLLTDMYSVVQDQRRDSQSYLEERHCLSNAVS